LVEFKKESIENITSSILSYFSFRTISYAYLA
jgi:hypothetical protein